MSIVRKADARTVSAERAPVSRGAEAYEERVQRTALPD